MSKWEWFGSLKSAKGLSVKESYTRAFHDPAYLIAMGSLTIALILRLSGVI